MNYNVFVTKSFTRELKKLLTIYSKSDYENISEQALDKKISEALDLLSKYHD